MQQLYAGPTANGKVRLCLDLAQQALIRHIHRGLTLNNILSRLVGMKYLTLKDMISDYHNLKRSEKSSNLAMFCCPFGMYQYIRLSFGVASVRDMFQRKIIEFFNSIPNVFDIADLIHLDIFELQVLMDGVRTMMRCWRRFYGYAGRWI